MHLLSYCIPLGVLPRLRCFSGVPQPQSLLVLSLAARFRFAKTTLSEYRQMRRRLDAAREELLPINSSKNDWWLLEAAADLLTEADEAFPRGPRVIARALCKLAASPRAVAQRAAAAVLLPHGLPGGRL